MALVIAELLNAGLLHEDVATVAGHGLRHYTQEPFLNNGQVEWRTGETRSRDTDVIRPVNTPFSNDGGLKLLTGNLGRTVIKVSAVAVEPRAGQARAIVFADQDERLRAQGHGRHGRASGRERVCQYVYI